MEENEEGDGKPMVDGYDVSLQLGKTLKGECNTALRSRV